MAIRQVGIELEPAARPNLRGQFKAVAAACGAGNVLALVLVVDLLGLDVEQERRELDMGQRNDVGAESDLLTVDPDQQRRRLGKTGDVFQQHGARHAADVV